MSNCSFDFCNQLVKHEDGSGLPKGWGYLARKRYFSAERFYCYVTSAVGGASVMHLAHYPWLLCEIIPVMYTLDV